MLRPEMEREGESRDTKASRQKAIHFEKNTAPIQGERTEVDHFKVAVFRLRREKEVLELEVAVDDPLRVQVPDRRQHLLDEPRALRLGVVVVRLHVEAVEQVSPDAELLDDVDLVRRLVHLVDPDDVGVVELAHDVNLVPQLPQPLRRVDEICVLERLKNKAEKQARRIPIG